VALEQERNMLQREMERLAVPVARESIVVKRLQEKIRRYEDWLGDNTGGRS
jgi:hypothetical protein